VGIDLGRAQASMCRLAISGPLSQRIEAQFDQEPERGARPEKL